jgi:hypothetical protein
MKTQHLVLRAIKFCGFLCVVYATSASAVMNTPSSWSVSPSGAFSYEIPFRLPPGIAGVQPKLSLTYSSQAGNGLAGMGWSLSGLSSITRCPRTMAVDGVRGGVNMEANDRLCLDGQRLILQSGTYGAEGATYATELYNGSRIVGTALTGTNNTRTFKVYTKAGELMEYIPFNTPANDAALMFMFSRVTDAKGNYWQVHYQTDIAQGETYPKAICYTGNSRLAQAPKNCVEFGYGRDTSRYGTPVQRIDKSLGYMAGFAMRSNQRISGIRTLINAIATASGNTWTISGAQVNEYRLVYDAIYSPVNKSLLKTVQECATSTTCLPAQQIAYNGSGSVSPEFDTRPKNYNPAYSYSAPNISFTPMEFNGDGRLDYILRNSAYSASDALNIAIGSGDGNFQSFSLPSRTYEGSHDNSPYVWTGAEIFGDFNGDGRADIISFPPPPACSDYEVSPIDYQLNFGNGAGAFSPGQRQVVPGHSRCQPPRALRVSDFDGNGVDDVLFENNLWSFNYSGGFSVSAVYIQKSSSLRARNFADFTGDGKTDILNIYSTGSAVVSESNGAGGFINLPVFSVANQGLTDSTYRFVYGDFNGDGKSDLVHLGSATAVKTWLSRGDGSFDVKDAALGQTFDAAVNDYKFHVGDFNGDGLTDMVQIASATQLRYWISEGDGTFSVTAATTVREHNSTADYNFSLNNYNIQVVDFNGDGKSDLMHTAEPPYFRALITAPTDKASLKLSGVTVGPNSTQINYGYLSSTPNYSTSGTPVAGQRFVRGALPVVTQIKSSNGLGAAQNTQTFKYGNALSESASGRGFLGFGWMEAQTQGSDGVLGPVSRTTYSQQWPCTGMPLQSQIKLPSGGLKNQSDIVIGVRTPANATPQACGTAALNGQVVIPFASESTTRQWEMTTAGQQGVELPRSRTTTTLDGYGNPLQIQEQTLNANGTASGYSRTTANTYDSNAERARQGRLIKSTVTHVKP